jgi:hypothetical protein
VAPSHPLQILGSRKSRGRIITGKAAVVCGKQIAMFRFRDMSDVRLPGVWIKDRRPTLVEPINFLLAKQKDAAKNEFGHSIGMCFGIRKGKRGAPASTEHLPAFNAEVPPDLSQVVLASRDA